MRNKGKGKYQKMTEWHIFTGMKIPPLFHRFLPTLLDIFSGKNLWGHVLAIMVTFLLVTSGFDWWYFMYFHASAPARFLFSAVWLGTFVPVVIPVILLVWGYAMKKFSLINTGWALGQSALLGWMVSSFYKIFTGRPGPAFRGHTPLIDISHVFRFGFWRGGIFWGWPSSHTTIAFAMAFALFFLFRKSRWARLLAPLYALYIGLGVSMSIHWFSDVIAGAVFGCIIGWVVGTSFLRRSAPPSGGRMPD
jgi:membrane-associated phospholipid phosphatase